MHDCLHMDVYIDQFSAALLLTLSIAIPLLYDHGEITTMARATPEAPTLTAAVLHLMSWPSPSLVLAAPTVEVGQEERGARWLVLRAEGGGLGALGWRHQCVHSRRRRGCDVERPWRRGGAARRDEGHRRRLRGASRSG
jgi:hypothetical protein